MASRTRGGRAAVSEQAQAPLSGKGKDHMAERLVVELGNQAPHEVQRDPDGLSSVGVTPENTKALGGTRVTTVEFPDDTTLGEALVTITRKGGVWDYHSSEKPLWVASNSPEFEALLAVHFECDRGKPEDVEETHFTVNGPPGVTDALDAVPPEEEPDPEAGFIKARLAVTLALVALGSIFHALLFAAVGSMFRYELRTDAGKDFQSRVMGDTASTGTGSYAAANYIGLTEDATAPAAGDTTLTGELVVGTSAGLQRAQATYAHTAGASTYTLTKTFTLTGATPRTINKIGIFNASASGTLVFETLVSSPPTLATNDQIALTETVTI